MPSCVVGIGPLFLGSIAVFVTLSSISVISLLADLTNTDGSFERAIGVSAIVSIVIGTILWVRLTLYKGIVGLIFDIILGTPFLLAAPILIGTYIYSQSNYFEYTGSMKGEG